MKFEVRGRFAPDRLRLAFGRRFAADPVRPDRFQEDEGARASALPSTSNLVRIAARRRRIDDRESAHERG